MIINKYTHGMNEDERKKCFFQRYSKETMKAFVEYHKNHPHIYAEFKKLSYKMLETGRKRYSAKMIINVLRWESDLKAVGEEFKITDRFQSMYARMLAYNDPQFENFFEFHSK
jgi:hypothetical protein